MASSTQIRLFKYFFAGIKGGLPAVMVEMFPTRIRFSSIAMGYNLSIALFGGTAPLVCTWLIKKTGNIASPAYYLMALAFLSLSASLTLRIKEGQPLE